MNTPENPYGVPTAVVPRRHPAPRQAAMPLADPIAQAVDDWLLMERKARAWDRLMDELKAEVHSGAPITPIVFHIIKTAADRQPPP
jgi:hypothetical protein